MKNILLLFIITVYSLGIFAIPSFSPAKMDSVLNKLDKTIANKEIYTEKKKQHIADLRQQLLDSKMDEHRFHLYGELFDELKSFQMDSALVVAQKRLVFAEILNSEEMCFFSRMNIAEVMIVTGMYKEALDILSSENRERIRKAEQYQVLYHLYHSLYILMAQYSFMEKEKDEYYTKVNSYKDSILGVLPKDNIGYNLVLISHLISNHKFSEAQFLADEVYIKEQNNNHILAMLMHDISDIYRNQDNTDELKYALTISAINDIESGVKEYMSLPELASVLYQNGDVERSYKYIKCALDDAIYCKARLRTIQMSQTLPLINASYDAKMQLEHSRLIFVICITALLVIVLAICLLYIYKKLKELAAIRRSLKSMNKELYNANNDLNKLNEELTESNKVKEEYIGYVFSICSLYINKLDNFRKKVNRQIKTGLTQELYKQTQSSSLVNEELKEFYKSFDTIFLKLFPDFIADFNQLLAEGENIYPKEGELLSPELRIYALVKLGINDSTKIATFLHYSPQTVYNYRLKVRNKSMVKRSDFPNAVRSLGRSEKLNFE